MKKIILFLSLILSTICFASCSCNKNDSMKISYAESSIVLYENTTYTIDNEKLNISNPEIDYKVYSLDEDVATVDNLIVQPKSIGKTQIRFELIGYSHIFYDVAVEVKSGKVAKNITLEKSSVNIDMTDGIITALNRITTNLDCDEVPTISYDVEGIVQFDSSTGVVTALNTGSTMVYINYLLCSTSFDVNVIKNCYVKSMIMNDCQVYANSSGKLSFQVFPIEANTYSFMLGEEDKDRTDFLINSDGSYKSFGATTITLRYRYYVGKNLSEIKTFEVRVIDKLDDIPYVIKDENGAVANNYLKDKTYTLILKVFRGSIENFQVSGEFSEKSELAYEENIGYKMTFKYHSIGLKNINISYNMPLGGVQNILKKTITLNVRDKTLLTIGAKWQSMEIEPNGQGKYVLWLDGGEGYADSITILLKVDNQFDTSLKYNVYQVISDNDKVEVSNVFEPKAIGEYTFQVYFEWDFVGEIVVLVQ